MVSAFAFFSVYVVYQYVAMKMDTVKIYKIAKL